MGRDEDAVVSRHDEAEKDQEQNEVRDNESGDHERIVSEGVEFGVRETEDNGKDGSADIAE